MAAIVMTTRKALAQLIAEPAIHAAVSTAAIEIKATKSAALTDKPSQCGAMRERLPLNLTTIHPIAFHQRW
jgi:hypothetical protein